MYEKINLFYAQNNKYTTFQITNDIYSSFLILHHFHSNNDNNKIFINEIIFDKDRIKNTDTIFHSIENIYQFNGNLEDYIKTMKINNYLLYDFNDSTWYLTNNFLILNVNNFTWKQFWLRYHISKLIYSKLLLQTKDDDIDNLIKIDINTLIYHFEINKLPNDIKKQFDINKRKSIQYVINDYILKNFYVYNLYSYSNSFIINFFDEMKLYINDFVVKLNNFRYILNDQMGV